MERSMDGGCQERCETRGRWYGAAAGEGSERPWVGIMHRPRLCTVKRHELQRSPARDFLTGALRVMLFRPSYPKDPGSIRRQ